MIYSRILNVIHLSKSLQQKKILELAGIFCSNWPKRLIPIAGASSSNETTFAFKLAHSLRLNGYESLVIGMDDYFLSLPEIPYGTDGKQDWECVTCLNLPLLGERMAALLNGEIIKRRRMNWAIGSSYDDPIEIQSLKANSLLILEGIHGLIKSALC
jgi:uridine kinase